MLAIQFSLCLHIIIIMNPRNAPIVYPRCGSLHELYMDESQPNKQTSPVKAGKNLLLLAPLTLMPGPLFVSVWH